MANVTINYPWYVYGYLGTNTTVSANAPYTTVMAANTVTPTTSMTLSWAGQPFRPTIWYGSTAPSAPPPVRPPLPPQRPMPPPRPSRPIPDLAQYLTPSEITHVADHGWLGVASAIPGRSYRVPVASGSMVWVYEGARHTRDLCLQPADGYLSNEGWMLLQVLLIRANERRYLQRAISWDREHYTRIADAWERLDRPAFAKVVQQARNERRRLCRSGTTT